MSQLPRDRHVALDIGSSTIRIVVADFESNKLAEVVGVGSSESAGISHGAVVNIDQAAESIRLGLKNIGAHLRAGIKHVVVGLSGQQIASLNSRSITAITRSSRRVATEDVERAIDQAKIIVLPPDREIIQCLPRGFRLDGLDGVNEPIGLFCNRLEVECHLVTSNYSHSQNVAAAVRAAGLEVSSGVVASTAAAESVATPDDKSKGVMVLDIGHSVTDISIVIESAVVFSAVLPIGGQQITSDLASALNLSFSYAEGIKLRYGRGVEKSFETGMTDGEGAPMCLKESTVSPLETVESIIRARSEQLFMLVRQELIKSGYYNLLHSGVVLTGRAAQLCGIESSANKILKMPTRVGFPIGSAIPAALAQPEFAVAIGLIECAGQYEGRFAPHQRSGPTTPIKRAIAELKRFLRA